MYLTVCSFRAIVVFRFSPSSSLLSLSLSDSMIYDPAVLVVIEKPKQFLLHNYTLALEHIQYVLKHICHFHPKRY